MKSIGLREICWMAVNAVNLVLGRAEMTILVGLFYN